MRVWIRCIVQHKSSILLSQATTSTNTILPPQEENLSQLEYNIFRGYLGLRRVAFWETRNAYDNTRVSETHTDTTRAILFVIGKASLWPSKFSLLKQGQEKIESSQVVVIGGHYMELNSSKNGKIVVGMELLPSLVNLWD